MKNANSSRIHGMDILCIHQMNQIKGGVADKNDGEWQLVYINGKPYWIKIDRNGQIIEMKSLF